MKVVINKCFGGFGLSPRAAIRMSELKGRPCYLFVRDQKNPVRGSFVPATPEEAYDAFIYWAYDIPNPNEALPRDEDRWFEMTQDERKASNALHDKHSIETGSFRVKRDDPDLVRAVEELGDAANGRHAELKVVEIPDGVEYEISEYDGREHVAEAHRTWG